MELERALRALQCIALLEEAAAEFYGKLAKVVNAPSISAALNFVSRESDNHAKLLKEIFGEPVGERCALHLGAAGITILSRLRNLAAQLASGWVPTLKEVGDLLEELNDLERFAGEEVYAQVAAAAFAAHLTSLEETLLATVSYEEKRHYEIIKQVIKELRSLSQEASR